MANYVTCGAKAKHHMAYAMLVWFSATEAPKGLKSKEQTSIYKVTICRDLESFFGAVKTPKPHSICNDHIICTVGKSPSSVNWPLSNWVIRKTAR